ncbi:MAG: ATP-binding cassette domain-containing protein [Verrucomicrobia bacterium]|nr:ATP-binding cassette domain-containing protein [Verrucomicrobiota bacterium]
MLFALHKVSFAYRRGAAPVLSEVTRTLPEGLTILQGPSGGGKSTFLKLLAGYLAPQAGTVVTRHGRAPDGDFQRRELGFVFQQFNLLPGVTLARNLELAGLVSGVSKNKLQKDIAAWLARLGLGTLAEARIERLSGGQVQRAALARALVKRPEVLLLDEPTSGLDDASTALIGEVVAEWLGQGRSAVISTHDPRLPAALRGLVKETLTVSGP